jgi:hypothetical protein
MGFTPPPTLPDYQKLKVILANSGVQKWNPPTYDILSRLIDAVSQSQDVMVSSAPGFFVDPLGALNGDGTKSKPLSVNVDGTTISINGSDQLTASGSSPVLSTSITLNTAALQANVNVLMLAAIPNKIIWPIAVHSQVSNAAGSFNFTTSGTLAYGAISGTNITGAFPLTVSRASTLGTWDGQCPAITLSAIIRGGAGNGFGQPVYVYVGGAPGGVFAVGDSATITMFYVVF